MSTQLDRPFAASIAPSPTNTSLSPDICSLFATLVVSWNGVSQEEAAVLLRLLDRLEAIQAQRGPAFAEAMARRVINLLRGGH